MANEKEAIGNTWDFAVPEADRDIDSYLNGKCKYEIVNIS